MSALKKLSRTLGQIAKGFAYDTPLGGFPVCQTVIAPDAASSSSVLALTDLADDETTLVTSGITDPDVYRTLRVVGNQSSVTGDVVVKGKDYSGQSIEETIALNGTTAVAGVRPFASIDSILLPTESSTAAGDKVSVGVSAVFGLQRPIKVVGDVKQLLIDNGSGASLVVDTVAAKSAGDGTYATVTPTTAANGAKNYIVFYDSYLL